LGFRGHFSTKSRAYSTTFGALRKERADHNEAAARERAAETGHPLPDPDTVLVLSHWRFAGTGLTAAEHLLAHGAPPPDAARLAETPDVPLLDQMGDA
ncbi:replication initiator, partial [Streptomyces fradiae]